MEESGIKPRSERYLHPTDYLDWHCLTLSSVAFFSPTLPHCLQRRQGLAIFLSRASVLFIFSFNVKTRIRSWHDTCWCLIICSLTVCYFYLFSLITLQKKLKLFLTLLVYHPSLRVCQAEIKNSMLH